MPSVRQMTMQLAETIELSDRERRFVAKVMFKLDGTPDHLNLEDVREYLYDEEIERIKRLHKLYAA